MALVSLFNCFSCFCVFLMGKPNRCHYSQATVQHAKVRNSEEQRMSTTTVYRPSYVKYPTISYLLIKEAHDGCARRVVTTTDATPIFLGVRIQVIVTTSSLQSHIQKLDHLVKYSPPPVTVPGYPDYCNHPGYSSWYSMSYHSNNKVVTRFPWLHAGCHSW